MTKYTKIVATVSDKRCDIDFIKSLYENGMNVIRMNTAHLDFNGVSMIMNNAKAVSNKIAFLLDTKGPEIRTTVSDEIINLNMGETIKLKGDPTKKTTRDCIYVSYPGIYDDIAVGTHILIDDGEIELEVAEKENGYLICNIKNNGELGSKKSVNVPGVRINLPAVTDRDREFIKFAAEKDIDFIAHSFVRNKNDVLEVQKELDKYNSPVKIIAKIENQEGVEKLDEILEYAYGIMIARGDMGIEIAQEKIPGIQRSMIRKCVEAKKPVIVATQMLHSMIKHPRPTRAEVTDVANAIYYRTDAIMLSGETAYGAYPVESVRTMSEIAHEVEKAKDNRNDIPVKIDRNDVAAYLAETAVKAVEELDVKVILTDSLTGRTARYLAAFRGPIPIFALCYNERVTRELALSYGVFTMTMEQGKDKREILEKSITKLKKKEILNDNDPIVYLGGSFGIGEGTTYMEITTVNNLLLKIQRDPIY
ncbi:MAG: pyruvate kinase [Chlorobi bacterium]|nr:pyruvate kinase [Chlorobiota bacterium]